MSTIKRRSRRRFTGSLQDHFDAGLPPPAGTFDPGELYACLAIANTNTPLEFMYGRHPYNDEWIGALRDARACPRNS